MAAGRQAIRFSLAKYVILRGGDVLAGGQRVDLDSGDAGELEDVSLWYNPRRLPRAWVESKSKKGTQLFFAKKELRPLFVDPLRVEIEVELARRGTVVLCDQLYPGWRLDVQTAGQGSRRVPIVRANGVMRAAELPAGRHRLIYRYRPTSFLCGAVVSGIGWIALGLAWPLMRMIRRKTHGGRPA